MQWSDSAYLRSLSKVTCLSFHSFCDHSFRLERERFFLWNTWGSCEIVCFFFFGKHSKAPFFSLLSDYFNFILSECFLGFLCFSFEEDKEVTRFFIDFKMFLGDFLWRLWRVVLESMRVIGSCDVFCTSRHLWYICGNKNLFRTVQNVILKVLKVFLVTNGSWTLDWCRVPESNKLPTKKS